MEPEAEQLMAECSPKNMIDKDEYPQTAELERRCVNILSNLWNAPHGSAATGCSTTGSSEACMLGGMALLWRWRARRQAAGLDASKPNLVMGSNVQVCWEKFCRYWQVEPAMCRWCRDGCTCAASRPRPSATRTPSAWSRSWLHHGRQLRARPGDQPGPRPAAGRAGPRCPVHVDGASAGLSRRSCSRTWNGISGSRGWRRSTPQGTSTAWCIRRGLGLVAYPGRAARGSHLQGQLPGR